MKMWLHIKNNSHKKGVFIDHVGGYSDHCHVLITIDANQKICDVIQLIKGESSHWINNESILNEFFEWQDEYFAVGVSESQIQKVRNYIRSLEKHHQKISFEEELKEFQNKYGYFDLDDISPNAN